MQLMILMPDLTHGTCVKPEHGGPGQDQRLSYETPQGTARPHLPIIPIDRAMQPGAAVASRLNDRTAMSVTGRASVGPPAACC